MVIETMATKRGRPISGSASEKKRKKMWYEAYRIKARVYIGEHWEKWEMVKGRNNLKSNIEVAGFLLDRYLQPIAYDVSTPSKRTDPSAIMVSTPAPGEGRQILSEPGISAISASSSQEEHTSETPTLSGIEEIMEHEHDRIPLKRKTAKSDDRDYVDPFELTIESDEDLENDDNGIDDEEYEPSFNITIGPKNYQDVEEVSIMESVLGSEDSKEDLLGEEGEGEQTEKLFSTGVKKVQVEEDIECVTGGETVIVYIEQLMVLAALEVKKRCRVKGCNTSVDVQKRFVGSAIFLTWVCPNEHILFRWSSQPVLPQNLNAGDLMIASAILLSGNNFQKVQLFAKFLNLHFLYPTTFFRMQTSYLVPAIDCHWEAMQKELLEELQEKDIVLLGDGRMDSPGHSAQYCSYSLIDNETKKILICKTVDKRETNLKSTNLELAGFVRALEEIKEKLNVVEVVTDAHLQIASTMKTKYKGINHQHDVWHASKNLGNKIETISSSKDAKDLKPWKRSIVNHFWHSCKTANSLQEFKKIWCGIQHHVVNEHKWRLSYGDDLESGACSHGGLEDDREKAWLVPGSAAHKALTKIIMDKRLLNKIPYWLNFRSTAECEIFHNHLLMYAAKRFAYTPPVYRARNLLAVMDYNTHVDRPVQLKQNGEVRYHRTYSKKTKRHTVFPVKVPKSYPHISSLLQRIVSMRLNDRTGMHQKVILEPSDPRRISKTLAPVEPPETHAIIQSKKSRFSTD